MDLLDPERLQQVLSAHPAYLGWAIAFIAFAESFAVVGILLPGVALLAAAAFVAGSGALSLPFCLASAFAGAVLGDGSSFLLGRHFHASLKAKWPFHRHPEWIAHGERFVAVHGTKSVVIGRFIGPLRPIVPVVAGMLGLLPHSFFLVNFLSALFWAPVYILPGYLLGAAVDTRFSSPALLLAAALALLAVALFFPWLRRHFPE